MSFSVSVTLRPVTHPRLHDAIFTIKKRSRAEVLRRYAEIGLLFEMGMLNINTAVANNTQHIIKASSKSSNDKDKYDDEISDLFEMINNDEAL